MSIVTNGGLVHLPFTSRVDYSTPYPEGLAVAHIDVVGDASTGTITVSVLADGLFLYRLEAVNSTRAGNSTAAQSLITSHRMLSDRSGLGASAFDLNWHLQRVTTSFSVFSPSERDLPMIKRLPIGRTDKVAQQSILVWTDDGNVNTINYDFDAVFSYWPVQALTRPGFLQAFWEAPVVSVGPAGD